MKFRTAARRCRPDPLIYRFYELVMINGPALKVLIEEEFDDGIMSAIDFDLAMDRQPDPKGDRVKIPMSGKFLPYKYYADWQRADLRVQGGIGRATRRYPQPVVRGAGE